MQEFFFSLQGSDFEMIPHCKTGVAEKHEKVFNVSWPWGLIPQWTLFQFVLHRIMNLAHRRVSVSVVHFHFLAATLLSGSLQNRKKRDFLFFLQPCPQGVSVPLRSAKKSSHETTRYLCFVSFPQHQLAPVYGGTMARFLTSVWLFSLLFLFSIQRNSYSCNYGPDCGFGQV